MPQPAMSFMTAQMPNAWLFGASPTWMAETVMAAVQPDVARDVLGGVANITSPQGGTAAWPQPDPAAPGTPSPDLGVDRPMMSTVFKPNSG
jgi:hypothetical protein